MSGYFERRIERDELRRFDSGEFSHDAQGISSSNVRTSTTLACIEAVSAPIVIAPITSLRADSG